MRWRRLGGEGGRMKDEGGRRNMKTIYSTKNLFNASVHGNLRIAERRSHVYYTGLIQSQRCKGAYFRVAPMRITNAFKYTLKTSIW